MDSARTIALNVLPAFAANVLDGRERTYGYYARIIGRSPDKEAMVIGHAMHMIGALCVIFEIPVAPLAYVKRANKSRPAVFERDAVERVHVLPHYNVMCLAARIHTYSRDEFIRIEGALREKVKDSWSPHEMWHQAVWQKPKGTEESYLLRSIERYKSLIEAQRLVRKLA